MLAAREADMLTTEEWDTLQHAVEACREPADRAEEFMVDADGHLVRRVSPRRGDPYQHRCPRDAFEAVANEVAEFGPEGFLLEDLRSAADIPRSQAAVAFAFLKERSLVVPSGRARHHAAIPRYGPEDAMIEYHALREGA
jgi:hypothetical protein